MTLINSADKLYLGDSAVDALYAGAEKIWPAFSPAKISGLGIWLDASTLALADGAAVTTWPDISGENHLLTPQTYTAPTFKTNALNDKPVVRFAGGTNVLISDVSAAYQHIFLVAMYRLPAFQNYVGLVGMVSTLILTANSGDTRWYPYEESSCTYHLNGVKYLTGWVGPMNSVYSTISVLRHPQHGSWSGYFMLGADRLFPDRHWDGDIAEAIAYDRVLSDSERQQVEGYLREKWGLVTGGPTMELLPSPPPILPMDQWP